MYRERHKRRLDVGKCDTADYITYLCLMTKRTFVLPVYVIRCVYNMFYSRSCLFFICVKITDLIYKDIELF